MLVAFIEHPFQPFESSAEVAQRDWVYHDVDPQRLNTALKNLRQTQDELSQVKKEAEQAHRDLEATRSDNRELKTR